MADDEQFSLCWNNFNSNLSAGFHESLCRGDLVDVTLAAEGQFVKAHRLVLSVCSPYFRKMFTQMPPNQHAFVFLKDVSHTALKDLIQFMYCGEVNVKQEALPAFISTAEALQIKGLTDSDPPPSQSPVEPSTPTPPQMQQHINTSPRVRQRTSTTRSYKIETVDDSGDDKPTTQIVIQTTAAPTTTATIGAHQVQQQQQQQQQQHTQIHHQQQQQQHHQPTQQIASTSTATSAVVSHKRQAQRSVGSAPHVKRTKSTIDPLEATDNNTATTTNNTIGVTTQQITVQAAVVAESKVEQQQQTDTTEYIDLPIELPTKSEPDYTEDAGEVDSGDHEGAYVEDDSYGDLRYEESYFTENEDGGTGGNTSTAAVVSGTGNASATTSKAIVKQQAASFSDSSYVDTGDQGNNDAQDSNNTELMFIESPWATPCLVLNNYMFNCHSRKNYKEYWRCHNYSKKMRSERCRARCVLENNKLKSVSGGPHNHLPHTEKIDKMIQRNRMVAHCSSAAAHSAGGAVATASSNQTIRMNDGNTISAIKLTRRSLPITLQLRDVVDDKDDVQMKEEDDQEHGTEMIHTSIMFLHE